MKKQMKYKTYYIPLQIQIKFRCTFEMENLKREINFHEN